MQSKTRRAYYLPGKLISAFNKECDKSGYVREKVVAAAMLSFLLSNAGARSKLFERLSKYTRGKSR